jgi:hypothetical protein
MDIAARRIRANQVIADLGPEPADPRERNV